MAGLKGKSGRKGFGLEQKVSDLKGILLVAVLEDCQKNPARKLFWAEKFVNRLMPNEIKGDGGAIKVQLEIKDSQYANIIRRENARLNSGTGSICSESGEE